MGFFRYFRKASTMALIGVFLITSLFASPAYSLDTKDSQLFITGFNAYLKRDYPAAIANLSEVLQTYPQTSLRDMSILWLSRAYFKAGNQKEAAQYMAQFLKEYPESPLKGTIEDELVELAGKYQRGEPIATQQTAKVDTDRQAAEKLALAKAETDRQAAEKLALAKAEADRQAADKLALSKAEADRQAAEKLFFEKSAADRQAAEKLAMAKAEADRQAADKLALAKAEANRQAAEKLALAKVEADRQTADKLALAKAEADRQAAEKLALAKAEADRQATDKLALAKAEANRQAAEKIALAKVESDRQAADKLALAKTETDRQAAEKLALAKVESDRQAADKLALAKAEADRQAAERLAQAKAVFITGFNAYLKGDYPEATANLTGVLEKYPDTSLQDMALLWLSRSYYKSGNQQEAGRYMSKFLKEYPESPLRATVEPALAELAGRYQRGEPLAVQQVAKAASAQPVTPIEPDTSGADKQIIAQREEAVKIAAEKTASDNAAQERASAAAKAEADRQAAEKLALAKAEADRQAAEKLALAKAEADRQATLKRAADKAEADRKTVAAAADQKKTKSVQSSQLKDQAIAEYKAVIARYPGTKAATNAANRLRELGVEQQTKTAMAPAAPVQPGENSNIFSVEVARQADLEFILVAEAYTVEVGKRISVPFEVLNRGNAPDSFTLESGLPGEYQPRFVAADSPDLPLVKTSQLMPGERFKGLLQFEMPNMSLDGERKLFPVKAHSDADSSISQSRPLKMTAKAPILRAVIKSDVTRATPGDRIPYRLVLLNVGSSDAKEVSLRLVYPPQYEPVDSLAAGFRNEGNDALVISGLQLKPGESKDIALTMKLKDSALAKEELFLHADLVNAVLKRTDNFVSAAVEVNVVRGVKLHAGAYKVIAIPGQTVTIPLAVSNTGNVRDNFNIKAELPVNLNHAFYLDMNGDGIRQSSEPRADHSGPLAPKEVANLLLEVTTAAAEKDGVAVPLSIMLASTGESSVHGSAVITLMYSRPVLKLNLVSTGGKVKPGEVNTFELSCINVGSSMAKLVDVRSSLPEQMELIASDPAIAGKTNRDFFWRFDQLGSGEKRVVKISYRIKSGTAVGTSLDLKNTLVYQDQVGNSY